jgi:transcriptional regulator with XRE-family HTH domain
MPLEKAFGQALRKIRMKSGLSQEELGFKSGYHRTYISLLERGLRSPTLKTIFDLSSTLDITPSIFVRLVETIVK